MKFSGEKHLGVHAGICKRYINVAKTTDVVGTSQLINVGFARLNIEIMNTSEPKSIL